MIVMVALFIGCEKANGGGEPTTPKSSITTDQIPAVLNRPTAAGALEDDTIVEINLDDLTFEEAFRIEYLGKGEGRMFWWRGNRYTTNLSDTTPIKWHDSSQWVTNSNDKDDKCYTNMIDVCGVCDGPGKLVWYKDWDEDGLGDPNISMTSCIYPSVDEE